MLKDAWQQLQLQEKELKLSGLADCVVVWTSAFAMVMGWMGAGIENPRATHHYDPSEWLCSCNSCNSLALFHALG